MDEMLSAIHRGKQAFKHLKNSLNRQGNDHLQPGRHLDTRERGMKGFLLANPRPARLEDPPKKSLDNDFCAPSFILLATQDVTANAPIKDNKFSVYRKSRPNLG